MSSYQFLLAAGEFDQLSIQSNGIALGVVTTPGKRGEKRFALASAAQLLRYFNDYFGVKYPLPKLDLIALPDGSPGTVEHWGAITALLFDAAASAPAVRCGIFVKVARAFAHQWLAIPATMASGDDFWLNEARLLPQIAASIRVREKRD